MGIVLSVVSLFQCPGSTSTRGPRPSTTSLRRRLRETAGYAGSPHESSGIGFIKVFGRSSGTGMSRIHSRPQPAVHPSALGSLVPHPTHTLRLVSAVARRIHHPWFQGKGKADCVRDAARVVACAVGGAMWRGDVLTARVCTPRWTCAVSFVHPRLVLGRSLVARCSRKRLDYVLRVVRCSQCRCS